MAVFVNSSTPAAAGCTTRRHHRQDPQYLPIPLELKSVDAGKGWAPLGPTDGPGQSPVATVVFEDPSIDASDKEIFHGSTVELEIHGAGFLKWRSTRGDWVYDPVPPILVFDPPIDPQIIEVIVNVSGCDV